MKERTLETQKKGKLLFIAAAVLSFLLSVSLWFTGYHDEGLFVGLWVPSILSLGTLVLVNAKNPAR